MMGGEVLEGGEESELVLGFAQIKLHHWACVEEDRRKRRARERPKAPILLFLTRLQKRAVMYTERVNCNYEIFHMCKQAYGRDRCRDRFPAMRGRRQHNMQRESPAECGDPVSQKSSKEQPVELSPFSLPLSSFLPFLSQSASSSVTP